MFPRFLITAVLLAAGPTARADTLFNVNAALQSGGSLTGTVTLNSTSDAFSATDVTAVSSGVTYHFNNIGLQGDNSGDYLLFSGYSPDSFSLVELSLFLPFSSLAGFNGSPLCVISAMCGSYNDASVLSILNPDPNIPVTYDYATTGAIAPLSASTPEPASLVLLGTGALGLAGAARRRLRPRG